MLKRINSIQNIGRFKSTTAGNIEFSKITLIFGRNTYGKSTIGDLLSSIESSDISSITTRRTIPTNGLPQQAEISFQAEGQRETSVQLSENGWHPNLPAGLRLRVFDDGFYHNNVFAARQFTRSTKENFSSFVIGAQGVAKALEIAEKNKQKGDATRERNKLQKAAFKSIDDLNGFLNLRPTESIELLKDNIEKLQREIDSSKKQKENASKILSRKLLNQVTWNEDFADFLNRFNNTLQASYTTIHDDARHRVIDHIQNHFREQNNADSWIKEGLLQNNGKCCQFCGQLLGKEAIQLLEVYRLHFDNSYQDHEKKVYTELADNSVTLLQERLSSIRLAIESNYSSLVSFPEMDENKFF